MKTNLIFKKEKGKDRKMKENPKETHGMQLLTEATPGNKREQLKQKTRSNKLETQSSIGICLKGQLPFKSYAREAPISILQPQKLRTVVAK